MIPLVSHALELERLRALVLEEVTDASRMRACACRSGSAR
jgi:hypothetical protein